MAEKNISMAVIRRLPKYHRYLGDLLDKDVQRISSKELSDIIGFTASQIRQDLNNFGGFGQQGYGYNVEALHNEIGNILGLNKIYNAVLIGAGNLDSENLESFVEENNIDIAILCIPKNGAQDVVDRLVNVGVKGIWNFAPIDLDVPKGVIVENVNLTESLFTLSYLMKENE